jgi:hypothetical protein
MKHFVEFCKINCSSLLQKSKDFFGTYGGEKDVAATTKKKEERKKKKKMQKFKINKNCFLLVVAIRNFATKFDLLSFHMMK